MKLLLTLILTIFLFNGCSQKVPDLDIEAPKEPEYVYVYKKMPLLKNKPKINSYIKKYNLFKKDHPTEKDMYIVKKKDLVNASESTQALRKIVYRQDRDIKFYRYQNIKFNKLQKQKGTK